MIIAYTLISHKVYMDILSFKRDILTGHVGFKALGQVEDSYKFEARTEWGRIRWHFKP